MSRIGRQPIPIPSGVQVTINQQHVKVKGPKGELDYLVPTPITLRQEDDHLLVERPDDRAENKALHGTARALISNMVQGVSNGFQKKLEINGVGYRASVQGNTLNLELGFSHPIHYQLPSGVSAAVERNVEITLSSHNKHLLGQTASEVRAFRPPEPYKGKGIKYSTEQIRRKVGKKNV
ncbi:MAG: 50S ribosomal protein L6 [bacterium]|jgi:large subunit ribosomal protein L6